MLALTFLLHWDDFIVIFLIVILAVLITRRIK